MINYTNYNAVDFLHDSYFIDWVLKDTDEHNIFWNEWLLNNPGKKAVVENARLIVSSITVKPLIVTLTDLDVDEIIASVKNRL